MKSTGCNFGLFLTVFFYLTLNILTFAICPLLAENNVEPTPIRIGEVLTFSTKIRGFPAGSQMMRVLEETTLNGQSVYHLQSMAKTNGIFSLFYNFEDFRESYVTKEQFQPLRYIKNIVDRKYRANIQVDFDVTSGRAILSKNNKKPRELETPVGIQDELSMFYLLRVKKLKVGEMYSFPALIGTKVINIRVEVVRRENTKTILGNLETIAVRSSHGYMVWITTDKRRLPVRIEAETKIGKIVGILNKVDYI